MALSHVSNLFYRDAGTRPSERYQKVRMFKYTNRNHRLKSNSSVFLQIVFIFT